MSLALDAPAPVGFGEKIWRINWGLILVLSAYVAVHMGPWVLAIGLMRYVFVAASWRFRWMNAPLPASYARKVVAAVQGIFLVVAASGLLPFAAVLVGLALASLV